MSVLVCDPWITQRLLAERKANGGDRFDEVWDGVYVMTPLPNSEHQDLAVELCVALRGFVDRKHAKIFAGINVSDREKDWEHNYRCPDIAVYLDGNPAKDYGSHWQGGPDFAVEILSPGDRARQKFDFYAQVGVRELLLVDRDPWALELYQLQDGKLTLAGTSTLEQPKTLPSSVLPLVFRLVAGEERPMIEATHLASGVVKLA